ncbi:MAG: hypothetical protein ACI3YD_00900 [Alloprevotella sp.]
MQKFYAMRNLALSLVAALAMPTAMLAQQESKVLFYESFDKLDGQGGNDGYFDNDAEAGVEVGAEDLTSADALDNTADWGDFVKVAICNKCVRIATKKNRGEITTPAFASDGKATLTFHAAAQLGDAVTLQVEVVGEGKLTYAGQTAQSITIDLPESEAGVTSLAAQVYTIDLTETTGNIRLKFSTESTSDHKQRAYIDEIKVVADTNTSIANLTTAPQRTVVYDLFGRRTQMAGKGIYIVNGKKVLSL